MEMLTRKKIILGDVIEEYMDLDHCYHVYINGHETTMSYSFDELVAACMSALDYQLEESQWH